MNRTIGDYTKSLLVVPDIAPDQSGAALLNQISRQTGLLAAQALKQWQEAEISTAAIKGKIAGTQSNVVYRPGTTLTEKAYNQAALVSQVTMTELKATTGLAEIAEVYKNDPQQYQEQSKEFIETITDELRQAGNEAVANLMQAKMTFKQQTVGYTISKIYHAAQMDKIKADNEMLLHTLKINTFHGSGAIFSADPEEQGSALTNFAVNKKLYDASLHMVLPDGTPIYSATAIQNRQQAFHSQFYINAVQNWVSEAEITPKELKSIIDGSLKITIPDVGDIIVADEVGVENYKSKIINYTMTKLREKEAARSKEKALHLETLKVAQAENDVKLLNELYTGVPISAQNIIEQVRDGKISGTTAKSAIKMINSSNTIRDDIVFVTDLKIRQIQGEDITNEVKANAHRISGSTYETLLITAAEAEGKEERTLQSEDEKWIVREMVKKNNYGIEDPRSIRLASDTVDAYRQKIEDGMSQELAFQEIRNTMDVLKDRANLRAYNSVPKYAVLIGNQIDLAATATATGEALKKGKISEETFFIEMERLKILKNERRGSKANVE